MTLLQPKSRAQLVNRLLCMLDFIISSATLEWERTVRMTLVVPFLNGGFDLASRGWLKHKAQP